MSEKGTARWKRLGKNGTWTLLVVIVVACAVVATTVVGMLEDTFRLQIDFTKNQIYSIGDATKNVLAGVDKKIHIYTVYPQGEEDHTVSELVGKYQAESEYIDVSNIDPIRFPLTKQKFETEETKVDDNSIIVAEADDESNYRVIAPKDLYEWKLEGSQLYATGSIVEQRVTSAINSVMGGRQSRIFFVEGHGELDETSLYYLAGTISSDDYEVGSYHLLYNDFQLTPEDCLIFVAPMKDLTEEESGVLEAFLDQGGKAVFLINPMAPELPNIARILEKYGMTLNTDLVVEGDPAHYYQNGVFVAPEAVEHPATEMIRQSDTDVVMSRCRSILIQEKDGVEISPLFLSSNQSYGKVNPMTETIDREDGDKNGPLTLAAAAEDTATGTRVVLYGSSDFISTLNNAQFGGNLAAFMESVVWVNGGEHTTVIIPPKALLDAPLKITSQAQSMFLIILVVGILPLGMIVIGVTVWRKRISR